MTQAKEDSPPKIGDIWYNYVGTAMSGLKLVQWTVDSIQADGTMRLYAGWDSLKACAVRVRPGAFHQHCRPTKEQALADYVVHRRERADTMSSELKHALNDIRAAAKIKESWDAERAERGAN